MLRIVYTKNQKELRTIQFKLYNYDQQSIRKVFLTKKTENKLGDFYKLKGNMTYFSFNVKCKTSPLTAKLEIRKICY